MKKLFISQPMRHKTEEEILATRTRAAVAAAERWGQMFEVLQSYNPALAGAKPLYGLGESIKLLSEADYAYFAEGWEDSRGCRIEMTCALEYGIPIDEE